MKKRQEKVQFGEDEHSSHDSKQEEEILVVMLHEESDKLP
jgi:hypothetical protein